MDIAENVRNSLSLATNVNAISDQIYKKLLDNCFSVLGGGAETHNVATLYNSKPDLIKELYAALLSATVRFVRANSSKDTVREFLTERCGYSGARSSLYGDFYDKHKRDVEMSLVNVGTHLPHVTDVNWKIDYIIKSSDLDESQGPLFRIALQTEKFDEETERKKIEFVNFTSNAQELQDLVYKLKDAVRHCQRMGSEH